MAWIYLKLMSKLEKTLIIDVDYGDSYSDSLNTYVTLYNSSQNSVAENDDSLTTLGGGGSSSSAIPT